MREIAVVSLLLLGCGALDKAQADTASDIPVLSVSGASDSDGRFETLVTGADGNVYQRWQQIDSAVWSDWSQNAAGAFANIATLRAAGRIYLFGVDSGGLVIRRQEQPGSSWSIETLRTGNNLRRVSAALNADGTIQIVALTSSGSLTSLYSRNDAPRARAEDWGAWTSIGGSHISAFALGADGDGRLTVAGFEGASTFLAQQRYADPAHGWRGWPSKLTPLSKVRHRFPQLVSGRDGVLWLLAIDDGGALVGRSLPRMGRGPTKVAIRDVASSRVDLPTDPRPLSPADAVKKTILPPPLPMGTWSDWATIIAAPFVNLGEIVAANTANGSVQVAGVADNAFVAHVAQKSSFVVYAAQNADGTWPTVWTLVPMDSRVTTYRAVNIVGNPENNTAIFATDKSSGKVFGIINPTGQTWDSQTWQSLGKIPGVAEPDVVFAGRFCLEFLQKDAATQQDAKASADKLRATIVQAIPDRIATATAGTQLASVVGNANASSRCINNQEILAVWLNHEVWPGVYQETPVIPEGEGFAYRIPAAALRGILGDQIQKALSQIDQITIDSYALKLVPPSNIEIDFDAEVSKIAFSGSAVATITASNQKPECVATLTASRPEALLTVLSIFVPNFIGQLIDFSDSFERDKIENAISKINVMCKITDAILDGIFLSPDDSPTHTLQILSIPYDRITVDETNGIVASGTLPVIRAPLPEASFVLFYPTRLNSNLAGTSSLQVAFLPTRHTDLDGPLTYLWTPSDTSSLRLAIPSGVDWPDVALFVYGVQPDPTAKTYDLGTMTMQVTDSHGQIFILNRPVSAATVKPN